VERTLAPSHVVELEFAFLGLQFAICLELYFVQGLHERLADELERFDWAVFSVEHELILVGLVLLENNPALLQSHSLPNDDLESVQAVGHNDHVFLEGAGGQFESEDEAEEHRQILCENICIRIIFEIDLCALLEVNNFVPLLHLVE